MRNRQLLASIALALASTPTCASGIHYVKSSGSDGNDGTSWGAAKQTVQAALDAAVSGDQVWVAAGTYYERIVLKTGVGLYGGFPAAGGDWASRKPTSMLTVLDGNKGGSVVTAPSGCTRSTVIDGFTIRNGTGTTVFNGSRKYVNGGGIFCSGASPTISNNTISGNTAEFGGGIKCGSSSAAITGNRFVRNQAVGYNSPFGAAIACDASSPDITGNLFAGNSAYFTGGAMTLAYGWNAGTVSGNTIIANTSGAGGGGIALDTHNPNACQTEVRSNQILGNYGRVGGGIACSNHVTSTIADNLIAGNHASWEGGGIWCMSSANLGSPTPAIVNNTFRANTAPVGGHVMANSTSNGGQSAPQVINNIVAFGSAGICKDAPSVPFLRNNCVYGNTGPNYDGLSMGDGDISLDPLFANLIYGTYSLTQSSPCINAGWNSAVGIGTIDIDGLPRITGGQIDIGCQEFGGLQRVNAPSITPGGFFPAALPVVTISCGTPDAIVRYTTDGRVPTESDPEVPAGWSQAATDGLIIRARAWKDSQVPSEVSTQVYFLDAVPPTISVTSTAAYSTTASTATFGGTAQDNLMFVSMHWSSDRGGSGDYSCYQTWSMPNIPLQPGSNVLTFTAIDVAGHTASKTVTVDRLPVECSVGQAKGQPDGSYLHLAEVVATAVGLESGTVFVEKADRSCGIKLATTQSVNVGQKMAVNGVIQRINGEYTMQDAVLTDIANTQPLLPVRLTTRTLGNDPTQTLSYAGINTTGLLVRVVGRVTQATSAPGVIYIDDGLGYTDGMSDLPGIRMYLPTGVSLPDGTTHAVISGISRVEALTLTQPRNINGCSYPAGTTVYVPSVWVRDADDIIAM